MGGQLYSSAIDENALKTYLETTYGGAFDAIEADSNNGNAGYGYNYGYITVLGASEQGFSIPEASANYSGVMSSADFIKLRDIDPDDLVYKDGDKVLSEVNFSKEYAEKLNSVEEGSERNVITSISIDGVKQIVTDRNVNLPISELISEKVDSTVSSAYIFKGSVDYAADLPTENNRVGDVYNILNPSDYGSAGVNVAWNGTEWDSLSGIFDTTEIDNSIETLESEVKDINERLDSLDGINSESRISALEKAVEILNGDDTVSGSVINTAMTLIEEALTWEEI